jgi:hypothetical protein
MIYLLNQNKNHYLYLIRSYDEKLFQYIPKRGRNDGYCLQTSFEKFKFYFTSKSHIDIDYSLIKFYNSKTKIKMDII